MSETKPSNRSTLKSIDMTGTIAKQASGDDYDEKDSEQAPLPSFGEAIQLQAVDSNYSLGLSTGPTVGMSDMTLASIDSEGEEGIEDNEFSEDDNRSMGSGYAFDAPLKPSTGEVTKPHYDDEEKDASLNESSVFHQQNESSDRLHGLPNLSRRLQRSGHGSRTLVMKNVKQKISTTIDLETGKKGSRAQCAMIREQDGSQPQCRRRRIQRKVENFASNPLGRSSRSFHSANHKKDDDIENQQESELSKSEQGPPLISQEEKPSRMKDDLKRMTRRMSTAKHRVVLGHAHVPCDDNQYNLVSFDVHEDQQKRMWYGSGLYGEVVAQDEDSCNCLCGGINPNRFMISYLFWAFRSSFWAVLLSAALWFYLWTIFFATLLYAAGHRKPHCLYVNGVDFGNNNTDFMDAYSLSWTTFSTVGYGLVHPGTSATAAAGTVYDCTGIKILAAIEAFVGILFASFWGAIFLSKVTRIASFAQVSFSESLLIRYGSGVGGVEGENCNDEKSDDGDTDEGNSSVDEMERNTCKERRSLSIEHFKRSTINCPVLEFRVLNRLQKHKRGEIIDATMNIVASIDDSQILKNQHRKKRRQKRGKHSLLKAANLAMIKDLEFLDSSNILALEEVEKFRQRLNSKLLSAANSDSIGESNEKVFVKLIIESQEHPFFKRLWLARHVLDHDSPLLRPEARELIRLNCGKWPVELNSADAVRKCVQFDQLIVSLSGTSNVDANAVYAQKIYNRSDLCIGYHFCNALFHDYSGCLVVNPTLLNVVTEQKGGGGEILDVDRSRHNMDVMIL